MKPTTVSRLVKAGPETVFTQLADGWIFPLWVVGATHMREVDDHWPEPGAELHHMLGAWPVMLNDVTRVLEMTPDRRLVLQAGAAMFGEGRVEITLEPQGQNCLVTMSEGPTDGVLRWIDNPLQRFALRRRNIESLARLATLAEHRVTGTSRTGDGGDQARSR